MDRIETLTCRLGEVTVERIEEATLDARNKDPKAIEWLNALLMRVAFITPEATDVVYETFSRSWLGLDRAAQTDAAKQKSIMTLLSTPAALPPPFWESFWGIVKDLKASPGEVTKRVAALSAKLPASFHERAEAVAIVHPGVSRAAERKVPAPFKLETLAELPPGSLGHDFYRLIADKQFDLEVLDREGEGVGNQQPGLRFLGLRIVQMHDVWHLAAGYTVSALHENALASFQLAQFGHNYSAMYLAFAITVSRLSYPDGLDILLQVIAEAWQHSRQCPSFMDIDWEAEWHLPTAKIRQRHSIQPFKSIYSHDLIEQAAAALNHPIFRSAGWLDRAFGLGLTGRLMRGAVQLQKMTAARQKRRSQS